MKVFVIEDDLMFGEMLRFQLMDFEQTEVEVFESVEAVLPVLNQRPDIILMDYNLDAEDGSSLSGKAAYDRLKKEADCPPIVFMSSNKQLEISYTLFVVKDDIIDQWVSVCNQLIAK